MSEKQEDSIALLLNQVRALNEALDSEQAFHADQLKALRLMRLTLMTGMTNCSSRLRELLDGLRRIKCDFDTLGLAVFSDKGQLVSFNENLERILGAKPSETVFANTSKKNKFHDLNREIIKAANLPWKRSFALDEQEHFEARLFFQADKQDAELWLSCLTTKLSSRDKKEGSRAACFMDQSELVQVEAALLEACQKLEKDMSEIDTANAGIQQILKRLKNPVRQPSTEELEALLPRTGDRPPVIETNGDETSTKVLIVDDIPINQKLLSKRLQKLNLESDFASNGQQGVEMAVSGAYCLIFMDCDMPVMDGFEATRLIRQAELETGRHVPIIALTSYDRPDDRERCLSAGMDEYLSKGASPNLLQEVVEWCLRRNKIKEDKHLGFADYEEELDMSTLNKTFSKQELNEVFELFLPSTNTLMRCLRMSLDERDVRSIGHFAYSLKGPFASMGMVMTGKLTARLVDAAEEGHWDEAEDWYQMLARNCEAMRVQLEDRASKA